METLAERLKAERDKAGITQGELAKRVGRGKRQSLISNIEAGTYKSSPYLPEIAYALGLHAMWLKTGIGPKELRAELNTIAPPPSRQRRLLLPAIVWAFILLRVTDLC